MEDSTLLIAPIYLLVGATQCYNQACGKEIKVITVGASAREPETSTLEELNETDKASYLDECANEPVLLSYIDGLPEWALRLIQSKCPQYKLDFSHTTQDSYYLNHCPHCGYKQGDFYLSKPSDGPFFPCTEEEALGLSISEIQSSGTFECRARLSYGPMEFILTTSKIKLNLQP
ncbi:hypothetical protein N8559_07995 [Gammaproteobacteria bacterium]|nr:hypothetical protein [Gammaproteobacteria bacterium]